LSSTSKSGQQPGEAEAGRFFDESLLAVARELRAARIELFPTKPDPRATSYYRQRAPRTLRPEDFMAPGLSGDLAAALRELWADEPALQPLATELAALADARAPDSDPDDGEVSPFIYVMF
jgi:hypothetical protein